MYRIFAALEDRDDISIIKDTLNHEEFHLVLVGSYSQALSQWFSHEEYDLAIVEVQAPNLNGWAILENIRQTHSAACLPVILLMKGDDPDFKTRVFDSGGSDILQSPLHAQELRARLKAYLNTIPQTGFPILTEKIDEKSSLARNKLFSIISHDLRNPLGAIKIISGMIKTACGQKEYREVEELLGVLNNTIEANFRLLDNLTRWARLQAGKTIVKPSELMLAPFVDDVIEIIAPQADRKQLVIDNQVSDDDYVFADAELLRYILHNLLLNAIKYTHEKDGFIVVSSSSHHDKTHIHVKDNGIGVTPVIRGKLFRIDGNISSLPGTSGEEGTGLGLLICREFAEVMSGNVFLAEDNPRGSEFVVVLPAYEGSDEV